MRAFVEFRVRLVYFQGKNGLFSPGIAQLLLQWVDRMKSFIDPVKNQRYFITLLGAFALLLTPFLSVAQQPILHWARTYGGSSTEIPYRIIPTADGGSLVGGFTQSKDEDVQPHSNRDYWDLWLAKLDACGNLQWERSYGGSEYETARDMVQTPDGGYLVLGETNSSDGGVIQGYANTRDIWLLKLDAQGNLVWQKRYGGTGLDIGNRIIALDDGNYLIAGSTSSQDGDIQNNHGGGGYTDGLLLRINPQGNILWSRCYGGSKNEELFDLQVINNRIYAAGYANSTDGDIPANQRNYDVWLLCIELNGNIAFSKVYGGAQNDVAYSMTRGTDNTLTLAGYTTSSDGDVSDPKGSQDFWILNTDLNGTLRWQRTAGGGDAEYANAIITDRDGGYLVGGVTYSTDGEISGARGEGDYWLLKLDASGRPLWNQIYGGSENDQLRSMFYHPQRDEYYLAGETSSSDGEAGELKGEADFGVIKLKFLDTLFTDTIVCPGLPFEPRTDTLRDACGYDSLILSLRRLTTHCEFHYLTQADTIYIPNVFTPNGDGKNDVFGAAGKIQGEFLMQIFNRNGQLVFQSNSIHNRWNGMYNGKLQPSGGFVYIIRYRDNKNRLLQRKGSFLLIRS